MTNPSKQPRQHPTIIVILGYWFAASIAWTLAKELPTFVYFILRNQTEVQQTPNQ